MGNNRRLGFAFALMGCLFIVQLQTGGLVGAAPSQLANDEPARGYLSSLNVLSPFYWFSSGQQRVTAGEAGSAKRVAPRSELAQPATSLTAPTEANKPTVNEPIQPQSWSLFNPVSWFSYGKRTGINERRSDDTSNRTAAPARSSTRSTTTTTTQIQLLEPVKLTTRRASTTVSPLDERQTGSASPTSPIPASPTSKSSSIADMFTTTKKPRIVTEDKSSSNKINFKIKHKGRLYGAQVDPANLKQVKNYSNAFDASSMNSDKSKINTEMNKADL